MESDPLLNELAIADLQASSSFSRAEQYFEERSDEATGWQQLASYHESLATGLRQRVEYLRCGRSPRAFVYPVFGPELLVSALYYLQPLKVIRAMWHHNQAKRYDTYHAALVECFPETEDQQYLV